MRHREKCMEVELARGFRRRKRSGVREMEEERIWGCDKGQRAKNRKVGLGKPGEIGTGSYNHTQPRRTESLSAFPCDPHELVCKSEYTCHAHVSLCMLMAGVPVVCVHLLSMCLCEHTHLWPCLHLCTHPWAGLCSLKSSCT